MRLGAEGRSRRGGLHADQAAVGHSGLPVAHRVAAVCVTQHRDECCNTGVFCDEGQIPGLHWRSDQHQLRRAQPNLLSTKPFEDRRAVMCIGGISFSARGLGPVLIGGDLPKLDQIEHMHRTGAVHFTKRGKALAGRVDIAGHVNSGFLFAQ